MHSLDIWTKSIDQYIEMRNVHTVNVFFIGIFLQRRIDENISIKSSIFRLSIFISLVSSLLNMI